jgi:hypothetical protein
MNPVPEKDPYEIQTVIETVSSDLIEDAPRTAICVIMREYNLDVDDVETAWEGFNV